MRVIALGTSNKMKRRFPRQTSGLANQETPTTVVSLHQPDSLEVKQSGAEHRGIQWGCVHCGRVGRSIGSLPELFIVVVGRTAKCGHGVACWGPSAGSIALLA